MVQVDEKKIDLLAELELDALIALLKDEEAKKSPAVLARVRNFLKDNRLIADPTNTKVEKFARMGNAVEIPDFSFLDEGKGDIS